MNSTLTLTLTRRADKIFRGDQDSVRFILQRSFHVCRMTCVTHAYIVSCFVKGMTVAVNQQIPLDTSRGEPGALYTSGLPSLHTLYGLLLVKYREWRCVCLCVFMREWRSLGGKRWGTWRLCKCIPKWQHKIPQGMWTSAPNYTRQDPYARKQPKEGGGRGNRKTADCQWVREKTRRFDYADLTFNGLSSSEWHGGKKKKKDPENMVNINRKESKLKQFC